MAQRNSITGPVRVAIVVFLGLLSSVCAEVQYVIAISIDGGRGDFIETFIETAPQEFPNFKRLRDASAHTFNARCDYDISMTVPDHLCMLTGRPVLTFPGLPKGVQHGYTSDSPQSGETVHRSGVNPTVYKASIFDVVHDYGASTALYIAKTSLQICDRSWDAFNGAPDLIGTNNGRDKIDLSVTAAGGRTAAMIGGFVETIRSGTLKSFTLFHIGEADYAGHSTTWTTEVGSMYRTEMGTVDGLVGQILDAIESNAALNGKVAVILTADHGGGAPPNSHTDAGSPMNYTIPFFLLAPGIKGGSDIHEYFENRFDPSAGRPTYMDARQPMRNGDLANLAAALLGLPSVPGSFMIPEFKKPLLLERDGNIGAVSWPSYLTGYTLESTGDLSSPAWTAVTSGIVEADGRNVYAFALPSEGARFFRLRNPSGANSTATFAPAEIEQQTIPSPLRSASPRETTKKAQKRNGRKPSRK